MEYFELTQDFWIARWLQKPSQKEIKAGAANIVRKGAMPTIGIDEAISQRIITAYVAKKKKCSMFGRENTDFDGIGAGMELPRAIVLLVLERKGFITRQNIRKK